MTSVFALAHQFLGHRHRVFAAAEAVGDPGEPVVEVADEGVEMVGGAGDAAEVGEVERAQA